MIVHEPDCPCRMEVVFCLPDPGAMMRGTEATWFGRINERVPWRRAERADEMSRAFGEAGMD